jgi:uncharacterized protein with ATP-grasp and redox domains
MEIYFDCLPCFVRQALDSVRLITNETNVQEKVLREVLHLASQMDLNQPPPAMAKMIHNQIRRLTGLEDPYYELKAKSNKLALQMYPELKEKIKNSDRPLETAVRLAIAGNIIDFAVDTRLDKKEIEKSISESLIAKLNHDTIGELEQACKKAKSILYIGDNAGEIVFDRLLIEQMPKEKITFVVKARPIVNDATFEDAEAAGLTDIIEVIENGSDAPGTILSECSYHLHRLIDGADFLIAKGQANYETLGDLDKDIFFMLKAKCSLIAGLLGRKIGDIVLIKNKPVKAKK